MKKWATIICFSIIAMFAAIVFLLSTTLAAVKNKSHEERNQLIHLNHRLDKYKLKFSKELMLSNKTLKNISLTGSDNSIVNIQDLIHSQKLIYRFNENACSSCVQDDLESLQNLASDIGDNNIVIIMDCENFRTFKILCNTFSINLPAYNYQGGLELVGEKDKIAGDFTAFFIVIGDDLEIKLPHISDEYQDMDSIYLEGIRKLFVRNEY